MKTIHKNWPVQVSDTASKEPWLHVTVIGIDPTDEYPALHVKVTSVPAEIGKEVLDSASKFLVFQSEGSAQGLAEMNALTVL